MLIEILLSFLSLNATVTTILFLRLGGSVTAHLNFLGLQDVLAYYSNN